MPLPRIAPEELERLKSEISVQRLAESRGIKLKPQGKDLVGLCPFRPEKSASLHITPANNLWHCFGCNEGGTVIDWVMKAEGVSFRHAVAILRDGAIPQGPITGKLTRFATVPKLPSPVSASAEDRELMNQVINYYHEILKKSPEGLSYLEKRGLKNSEAIDRFRIGYANRTLGLRLPDKNRQAGAAIRERLLKVGILRETGHEHFNGSIVFPVFDENGEVAEIYGRKTCHKLTPGLPYHMYLPGPHKGVFNLEALKASKDIILCEAIIDALTFWCAGFRNVTASYGVNGFTPDHLAAFKKYGVERVYIAYDRDQAGDDSAKKLAETLIAEGFECFRILFPRNMDANAYALSTKPAQKALDLVFRNATWIGKGKRESVQVPEIQEAGGRPKEPKEATKEERIQNIEVSRQNEKPPTGEPEKPEALSQASPQPETFSPLNTKEKPADSPKPEPARNAPVTQACEPIIEIKEEEIIIKLDTRRWRVRGLSKNMSYDQLKVNLLISHGEKFYVDTFDLYSARCRAVFTKQASEELRLKEETIKLDLGRVLLKLEELQDNQIKTALEPKEKVIVLTPEEKAEAMELLTSPNLLTRILSDFAKCGIVGEETNKLIGYLAAVSRKLEKPLAIIIQSSSSAGKTLIMDSILSFMPDEERIKYSAMTGQSLFYMGEKNLQHKILAIVEEEGAERASYALKLLQSEGELSIASTGKDPSTGRLVTHEYRVQGPVMIFITTTNIDIDLELQNRCIVLAVDESREQTRAIHRIQREMRTLEGLVARKNKSKIFKLHQNAQRLLKPIYVINRFARKLTFLDDQTRTRRDNEKYLSLIESITLLHQYQRLLKTNHETGEPVQCLEVTLEDIEIANKLTNEILGHSLNELPPQSRRFLMLLEEMVMKACERLNIERSEYRFHRREILDYTGWSYNQLRIHLDRLVELEYLLIHRGYQGQRFCYELLYDGKGKDGKPFCIGLIDVEAEKRKNSDATILTLWGKNETLLGETGDFVPPLFPGCAPVVGGVLGQANEDRESISGQKTEIYEKNAHIRIPPQTPSYENIRHTCNFHLAAKEKGNGSGSLLREIM